MRKTSGPADEKVPEFSPIFPRIAISQIAKLEVHIQYKDRDGELSWADCGEFPVYASWEDIRKRCGGGYYKAAAKGPGKVGFLDNMKKRLNGAPKFLNEIRDAEEGEDDITGEDPADDIHGDFRAIVNQQSAILPSAFTSLTTAIVAMGDAHAERMQSVVTNQQTLVSSHAASLEALRTSYRAECDGYRLEIQRMQVRITELEKKNEELTGSNAGFLRAMAQGDDVNKWVAAFKQIAPELPKLKALIGTKNQLPAPAVDAPVSVPRNRLTFGS